MPRARDGGDNAGAVRRLSEALTKYGIQPGAAELVADGLVRRLKWHCWDRLTDIVGDASDIDALAGPMVPHAVPAGCLAPLLVRCGLLGVEKGQYYCPSAYDDRPFWLHYHWQKKAAKDYEAAKRRATETRHEQLQLPFDDGQAPPHVDLWGEPVDEPQEQPKYKQPTNRRRASNDSTKRRGGRPDSRHVEVRDYWLEQWYVQEGRRRTRYPFRYGGADSAAIKQLIERTASISEAKAAIRAYLQCKDKFYRGHSLQKLIGDLPRFVSAANAGSGRELAYSDQPGSSDLPVWGSDADAGGEGEAGAGGGQEGDGEKDGGERSSPSAGSGPVGIFGD